MILVERDAFCPSLSRALTSSGEPLSLRRTINSPLASEFLTNCPVTTISFSVVLVVKSWISNVASEKIHAANNNKTTRKYQCHYV